MGMHALKAKIAHICTVTAHPKPAQSLRDLRILGHSKVLLVHAQAVDFLRCAGSVCPSDQIKQGSEPHDTAHADLDPCTDRRVLQPRCRRCSRDEPLL